MKDTHQYIIGIDEAGRGPLAGPVAVGAVLFSVEAYKKFKEETKGALVGKDSKKLTEKKRNEWFTVIKEKKRIENCNFSVAFSSSNIIDKKGIVYAINSAIEKIFSEFNIEPHQCMVLLDGNLKAPKVFVNQKTIIKGDEKELAISLASIVAKVSRDEYIVRLSKKYPEYGFERHKGYGTKAHYEMIQKYGLCNLHRRSFLKKLLN